MPFTPIQQPAVQEKKTGTFTPIEQPQQPQIEQPVDAGISAVDEYAQIKDKEINDMALAVYQPEELEALKQKGKIGFFEAMRFTPKTEMIAGVRAANEIYDTARAGKIALDLRNGGQLNDADKETVRDLFRKDIEKEIRGFSVGGKIGDYTALLATAPATMIELAASFGVGRGAVKAAEVATKKALKSGVSKAIATGVATTVAAPQLYIPKYNEIKISDSIALTDKGQIIAKEGEFKPATAAVKALTDTAIEVGSEMTGAALGKYIVTPAGKFLAKPVKAGIERLPPKVRDKLYEAYKAIKPTGTLKDLYDKAQFHGIIEELGEERVGDILRTSLDLDQEEGYSADQFLQALYPSHEQILKEFGYIAVGGGTLRVGAHLYDMMKQRGVPQDQIDDIMENTSVLEKEKLFSDMTETEVRESLDYVKKSAFDRMAEAGIDKEQADAASQLTTGNALWMAKQYDVDPRKYWDSLKLDFKTEFAKQETYKDLKKKLNEEPDVSGIFPKFYNEAKQYLSIAKTAVKKVKAKSLSGFIRSRGGIYDVGGELKRAGVKSDLVRLTPEQRTDKGLNNFKRGFQSNLSIDNLIEKAFDAGYFPQAESVADISHDDFLQAVVKDYNGGKIYPQHLMGEVSKRTEAEQALAQYDEIGVTPDMSVEEAASLIQEYFILKDLPIEDSTQAQPVDPREGATLTEDGDILYQPAYHGTPHKFDKFTLDHIGTGEGAQAYGWGLYFASRKQVAEFYREQLAPQVEIIDWSFGSARLKKNNEYLDYSPRESTDAATAKSSLIEDILIEERNIVAAYKEKGIDGAREVMLSIADNKIKNSQEEWVEAVPTLKVLRDRINTDLKFTINEDKGQLYEVELPESDVLLDWDKSLSQQPKAVFSALESLGVSVDKAALKNYDDALLEALQGDANKKLPKRPSDPTGEEIYKQLIKKTGSDKAASLMLKEVGIKGIKYLDGGSRFAGEGTHNFVIFDQEAIKVLNTFYQDNRGQIQFFEDGRKIITLFDAADTSTLFHEMGHLFLREVANAATQSTKAKEQFEAIKKFLGSDNGYFTREQEEQFAVSFEQYVAEGIAPSNKLRDAFEAMKEFMLQAYEFVTSIGGRLNNETRKVFDDIMGGKDLDIYYPKLKIENHESGWAKFYRYMVDDLEPIAEIRKHYESIKGKLPDGTNVEYLARLYASVKGRILENIQNNTYYFGKDGNVVITGEGFKTILEDFDLEFGKIEPDFNKRQQDFKDYLISRRYLQDLQNREDVEVNARQLEESAMTEARLNVKYGADFARFPSYAQRVYDFQKRILENLVRSGIMAKDSFDAVIKANPNYIPFQRVFDENEIEPEQFIVTQKGKFQGKSAKSIVKKIEGSDRDVKDPFENILKNTARILQAQAKNDVARNLASMADVLPENVQSKRPPMQETADKEGKKIFVPAGTPFGHVIEYRENGKRKFIEVSKALYEAMNGLHPSEFSGIVRLITMPMSFFRAAATLPPDFILRNWFRDVIQASIQSKSGVNPVDIMRGITAAAGKNDLYKNWRKSGGSFDSYMDLSDNGIEQAYREVMSPRGKLSRYLKSGGIELLKDVGGVVESATRIGIFSRAKRAGVSDLTAALESRDGTLDFSRAGRLGRVLNRFIPFLNAGIQGTDKLFRAFKQNPEAMAFRAMATITMPSLFLSGYYLFVAPDDERKEYLEIPQWQKDIFFVVKVGDTWMRLPKPFALGYAFGTMPERFMHWAYNSPDKPEAESMWRDLFLGLGGTLSPIQDAGSLLTPVGKIAMESMANYNFFTGRNIYPTWMEKLPPEMRANKYTSETAKAIGNAFEMSPALIDNAIRGMLATSTPYVMGASDGIVKSVKEWNGEDIQDKPKQAADMLFLRGFATRRPSGNNAISTQNFYRKYDEVEQRHNGFNQLDGADKADYMRQYQFELMAYKPMKNFRDKIQGLNKMVDEVYDAENLSDADKIKRVNNLEDQILDIAKKGNMWFNANRGNE
jgi:hypothetical protein